MAATGDWSNTKRPRIDSNPRAKANAERLTGYRLFAPLRHAGYCTEMSMVPGLSSQRFNRQQVSANCTTMVFESREWLS
jgi:hypothetical protein